VQSIYTHCREDLIKGKAKVNSGVVNVLLEATMEGNINALMYWTKHRCGWKEGENPEDEYDPETGGV